MKDLKIIIGDILILILFLMLVSCKTKTVYVPVENTRIEYIDKIQRDSIYLRDSLIIKEKGDTIFIEKYQYLYKDKIVRDSVFIRDSIQVPYPVEVPVYTNKINWYQRILIYLGLASLLFVIFFLIKKKIVS